MSMSEHGYEDEDKRIMAAVARHVTEPRRRAGGGHRGQPAVAS